uniref:Uncharacterized protein n=1 Tax=Anguilla anguilla TaxID=7936 RepID=A0A0E9VPG2_ANGAN
MKTTEKCLRNTSSSVCTPLTPCQ